MVKKNEAKSKEIRSQVKTHSKKGNCVTNFFKYWLFPSRLSYDEKVARISFFIVNLVLSGSGTIAFIGRAMAFDINSDQLFLEIFDRILMAISLYFPLIFCIIFILIRQRLFQFFVFLVIAAYFITQALSHFIYSRSAGLLEGSPVIVAIGFVLGMSLFFGNTFNIAIWIIGVGIFLISGFFMDVFNTDLAAHFADKTSWTDRMGCFFLPYIMVFCNCGALLTIILLLKRTIRKNNFLMNEIGKSILELSFNTKPMIKLINKKTANCSNAEKFSRLCSNQSLLT